MGRAAYSQPSGASKSQFQCTGGRRGGSGKVSPHPPTLGPTGASCPRRTALAQMSVSHSLLLPLPVGNSFSIMLVPTSSLSLFSFLSRLLHSAPIPLNTPVQGTSCFLRDLGLRKSGLPFFLQSAQRRLPDTDAEAEHEGVRRGWRVGLSGSPPPGLVTSFLMLAHIQNCTDHSRLLLFFSLKSVLCSCEFQQCSFIPHLNLPLGPCPVHQC